MAVLELSLKLRHIFLIDILINMALLFYISSNYLTYNGIYKIDIVFSIRYAMYPFFNLQTHALSIFYPMLPNFLIFLGISLYLFLSFLVPYSGEGSCEIGIWKNNLKQEIFYSG